MRISFPLIRKAVCESNTSGCQISMGGKYFGLDFTEVLQGGLGTCRKRAPPHGFPFLDYDS